MSNLLGLLGVGVILLIAFALSTNRARIETRTVFSGVLLQILLAFLLLRFDPIVAVFDSIASVFNAVIRCADAGSRFIFGSVSDPSGAWGFVFAFKVLPVIVFFAALMSVLYHLGVMQRLIAALAWIMRRTMRVSGTEAMCAAANVFVGQTEAPLCIRPYLASMTRSQIMAVMTGGFATIAGSVMAAYVGLLGGDSDEQRILFAKHLITASLLSAPASLVLAKLMVPEGPSARDPAGNPPPPDDRIASLKVERTTSNVLDAAAAGATDGLKLAANVAAMLVAFVSLLALADAGLAALSRLFDLETTLSLELILGFILRPVAWIMNIPSADARFVGSLVGTQIVATEFVAYAKLSTAIQDGSIQPRTAQILTYALCGFANFPSIAIQIGGLSALEPKRRAEFASLGLRAMAAGLLACWMTAAIASIFIA